MDSRHATPSPVDAINGDETAPLDATTIRSAFMGLSPEEARARLVRSGPNVVPTTPPVPAWRHLVAQFVHFFALLLWGAGLLAVVAGMPELGIAIFLVILINGVFAFIQEHRAEHAAERLRDLLPRRATVRRGGSLVEVDVSQLVVGDIVVLMPGDRVSADMKLIDVHGLSINTSMLTGESVPSIVGVGDDAFAGTYVIEGEGVGYVETTGMNTRLAGIAQLTRRQRRKSPLAVEIELLVRTIAAIALGVGLIFFAFSVFVGMQVSDGFLFAIGITVALVPEGLLPTVTLSLAIGAERMAGRSALVRRLESVETLGSTTFICTDKTGTLTRNEMTVVEVWTPAGLATITGTGYSPQGTVESDPDGMAATQRLAHAASMCCNGRIVQQDGHWIARGDPMEAAIDAFARKLGIHADEEMRTLPPSARFPFDPRRRRTSLILDGDLLVSGAPDSVVPRCFASGDADSALQDMTARGRRVIAVARRTMPIPPTRLDPEQIERDLELLGLIGLEDPPREEARDAVDACRAAGIRLAMITGDHPGTARAIAIEVGLQGSHGVVLEGKDLPDDDDRLGELIDADGIVISRVTPEQKLRIAEALQKRGHVVAMTGDGVNDGPALQQADIGIAMGKSGTDVAREAADLILLDDNFATIIAAIEQGRATYSNVRRSLTYHLTDNVAELTPFAVWALSGGTIPLALGVLQILCLDIASDILPATALGAERPHTDVLKRQPHTRHLIDRTVLIRAFGVLGPVESVLGMAAFIVALTAAGWTFGGPVPAQGELMAASGAAFAAIVFGQSANAFACRSSLRWPGALGWRTNRLLLGAVVTQVILLAVLLLVPPIASLLDHAAPPLAGLFVALSAIPAVLLADAVYKKIRFRNTLRSEVSAS